MMMLRRAGGESKRYWRCVMVERRGSITCLAKHGQRFSSSATRNNDHEEDNNNDSNDQQQQQRKSGVSTSAAAQQQQQLLSSISHQRVWISPKSPPSCQQADAKGAQTDDATVTLPPYTWDERVVDQIKKAHEKKNSTTMGMESNSSNNCSSSTASSSKDPIQMIEEQEWAGGRMKTRQLGVLHEDPVTDMRLLTHNYTVGSLASALRDREDALQQASVLAADGKIEELQDFLSIFHPALVLERRVRSPPSSSSSMSESTTPHPVHQPAASVDITQHLDDRSLERLRRSLMRMPRNVISAHAKRAAVVLALCTIDNVPCLLMEKRAENLRSHAAEVCLPGGMVCEISDSSIVDTCLREMKEEIGGLQDIPINVLGVFRCNWGDVHHLVGVAVTPVVCFLGELPERLYPNPDEVSQVFTISLASLLEKDLWVHKDGLAPIFVGGPYPIWGLTGYILDKFAKEILRPNQHTTTAKQRTLYKNNALDS